MAANVTHGAAVSIRFMGRGVKADCVPAGFCFARVVLRRVAIILLQLLPGWALAQEAVGIPPEEFARAI